MKPTISSILFAVLSILIISPLSAIAEEENTGSFTVSCVEKDTMTPVPFASVEIVDGNGNWITFQKNEEGQYFPAENANVEVTANEFGEISFVQLPEYENYTVIMHNIPMFSPIQNIVSVVSNSENTPLLYEKESYPFYVTAISTISNKELPGIVFYMTDTEGNLLYFQQLADGTLGYSPIGNISHIATNDDGNAVISEMPKGELNVYYYDPESESPIETEIRTAVSSAETAPPLELYVRRNFYQLFCYDEDHHPASVSFSLSRNGQNVAWNETEPNYYLYDPHENNTMLSSENGECYLSDIPFGDYLICVDPDTENYEVPEPITLHVDSQKETEFSLILKRSTGSLDIIKEDIASENVYYQVFDMQHQPILFTQQDGIFIPAENGDNHLFFNRNGKIHISELKTGNYYIEENIKGISKSSHLVHIQKNQKTVYSSNGYHRNLIHITDNAGNSLPNIQCCFSQSGNQDILLTSDMDGIIDIQQIPDGEYLLSTRNAPETLTNLNNVKIVVINQEMPDLTLSDANISITINGIKTPVTFLLENDSGYSKQQKTNDHGECIFNGIPYGEYILSQSSAIDDAIPFQAQKIIIDSNYQNEQGKFVLNLSSEDQAPMDEDDVFTEFSHATRAKFGGIAFFVGFFLSLIPLTYYDNHRKAVKKNEFDE